MRAGYCVGRLALTGGGGRERDRAVVRGEQAAEIPLVTMMAGGYNHDHALTIEAHASVVLDGLEVLG